MKYHAIAAALLTTASPVLAQQSGWEHTVTVSGWFSGLDSSVDTRFGTLKTELDFSDVWENLEMAFFRQL